MACNTWRLLTKEELMKAVWGDTIVEESNLTQSVFPLRKASRSRSCIKRRQALLAPSWMQQAGRRTFVRSSPTCSFFALR
jgi:hypothetical protein